MTFYDGCFRLVLISVLFYAVMSKHVIIEEHIDELLANKDINNEHFDAIPVVHYNSFIEVEDGSCLVMNESIQNSLDSQNLLQKNKKKHKKKKHKKKKHKKKKHKKKKHKKKKHKKKKHKKHKKGKKGKKSKKKKHKHCTKNKPQCKPNFHCPIPNGVCCSGGSFCCPQGSKCSGDGRCQQTGIQRAMAIARMKMEEEGRKQLKKKAKKASKTEGGQKRIQEMKTKATKAKAMRERLKKKAAAVAMKAQKAKKKRLEKRKKENAEKKRRMKLRMKKEKAQKTASKHKIERRKKHERSKKHAKNVTEKKQKSDKKARQRELNRQKKRKKQAQERGKKERASKRVTWKTITSRVMHPKQGKAFPVANSASTASTYSFWVRLEGRIPSKCNIFRHGTESSSHESSPSVGILKGSSTKLHIVSSVKGGKGKNFAAQTPALPMFKWVHIVIQHKPGRFVVSLNGKIVIDRFSPPPIKASGRLWMSAGGMKACAVSTADLKFAPKWVPSKVLNKYRKNFLKRADNLPGFKDKTKVIAINVNKNGIEPKRGKKLSHVALPRSYAYTVMMWIKQQSIQPGWSSIFQRGNKNFERAPAMFVHPHSTRIHMCVTAARPNNCINSPALKMGEWHHIVFSVESGRMVGYVDGVKFASQTLKGTPKWVDGPTYVSSPFYPAFAGQIAHIEFVNKGPSFVKSAFIKRMFNKASYPKAKIIDLLIAKKTPHEPKQNFVIRSASKLIGRSHAYTAMMWIYIRGKDKRWTSIFHRGSTNHERLPAIFQYPGDTRLAFCSSTRKNWNHCVNSNRLQMNRWYHIAVASSSTKMEAFIDGKSIGSRRFSGDKLISPVGKPVYAGDPWYKPFPGQLSGIQWLKDQASEKFVRTIAKQKKHPKKSSPHIETIVKSRIAFKPQRNTMKLKGRDIPKTYSYAMMFWLKLTGKTPQWSSIVHKGRRNMERLPAIFVWPGDTRIHACASPQVGHQNCVNSQRLKLNKWYHISVVVDTDGIFGYVNAKSFGRRRFPNNGIPLISKDANIYVSDPWYKPVKGVVSDMKYITSGHNLVNKDFLQAVYNQKMHPN